MSSIYITEHIFSWKTPLQIMSSSQHSIPPRPLEGFPERKHSSLSLPWNHFSEDGMPLPSVGSRRARQISLSLCVLVLFKILHCTYLLELVSSLKAVPKKNGKRSIIK